MENGLLTEANRKKIEAKLSAVEEHQQQKNHLLSPEESTSLQAKVVRISQNLIEENRLKGRQAGAVEQTYWIKKLRRRWFKLWKVIVMPKDNSVML